MKKRLLFLLIIPLSLLILVGGGLGIFRYATQGKLYTADGLRQNTRAYMEEVYYEDGIIYYTLVNKKPYSIRYGYAPTVQKQVNGEWQTCHLNDTVRQIGRLAKPYSGENRSQFSINARGEALIGEYRLVIMQDRFAVTGYFSIEADP